MGIDDWRSEIDDIDREIVRLLNARARIAIKVGTLKRTASIPVCDPTRETKVLKQVQEWNHGPLDQPAMTRLFARIIRESRRLEVESAKASPDVRMTGGRS